MLIPMNLIILASYVYVDSIGVLNAYKLCICWFQYIFLILANNVYVDSTGFWMLVNYVFILLGFWMLLNFVYVDSNGFTILVNYVYVDSTGGFECL